MALMPKRVKYRKVQRGSLAGNAGNCNKLDFGEFGLQVLDRGWMTARQIEACRVTMTRHTKRRAKVWFRVFPDKPISKKEIRASRAQLVSLARTMVSEGQFTMDDIFGQEELE